MRRAIAFAALALAASVAGLLAGCGGDPAAPPGGEPVVTVGNSDTGGDGFRPMTGDVALIPGAQGGFHVWLKYRVAGMPAGPMRVRHSAVRASDGRPVLVGLSRAVDIGAPGSSGNWEAPVAAPAFMCPTPIGVGVDGQRIRFKVEILDGGDHPVASGESEATPHCPEGDQAPFCARICNG